MGAIAAIEAGDGKTAVALEVETGDLLVQAHTKHVAVLCRTFLDVLVLRDKGIRLHSQVLFQQFWDLNCFLDTLIVSHEGLYL